MIHQDTHTLRSLFKRPSDKVIRGWSQLTSRAPGESGRSWWKWKPNLCIGTRNFIRDSFTNSVSRKWASHYKFPRQWITSQWVFLRIPMARCLVMGSRIDIFFASPGFFFRFQALCRTKNAILRVFARSKAIGRWGDPQFWGTGFRPVVLASTFSIFPNGPITVGFWYVN